MTEHDMEVLLRDGKPEDFKAFVKRAKVRDVQIFRTLYGFGGGGSPCPTCGERKAVDPCPHCGYPGSGRYANAQKAEDGKA
jgi:hypothetical protein